MVMGIEDKLIPDWRVPNSLMAETIARPSGIAECKSQLQSDLAARDGQILPVEIHPGSSTTFVSNPHTQAGLSNVLYHFHIVT